MTDTRDKWQTERDERIARNRERNAAFNDAARLLAAALSDLTGDTWAWAANPYCGANDDDEPGHPRACYFRRTRDGARLDVTRAHDFNEADPPRVQVCPIWPRDTQGSPRRFSDARCVPYGTPTPSAGFRMDTAPRTAAKAIARKVLTPAVESAWAEFRDRDRQAARMSDEAGVWRDHIAAATGRRFEVRDNGSGPGVLWDYRSDTFNGAALESPHAAPGGRLVICLPTDPAAAARIIAAVDAARAEGGA